MRSLRHAAAALVGAAFVAAAPPPAAAAAPLERLVERYSPILMLKRNDDLPCGKSGEQYLPASVEIMLGNPDVKLVLRRKGRNVLVKRGPTSSDIAGLDENHYLDQPGVPYRPRCTYARESQRLTRGRRPVIYAHLAREPGLPGLALQYWFYYWFNRFNDLHESDWEGIQLVFEASTVEKALARGPMRVAYAQHGGGELADWNDDKLERRGTHPVVYVSSGSHASQYEQALYLGRGRQGRASAATTRARSRSRCGRWRTPARPSARRPRQRGHRRTRARRRGRGGRTPPGSGRRSARSSGSTCRACARRLRLCRSRRRPARR
jgi:hypothetical protein